MYYDPREQQKRQQEIKIAQSNAAVTPITPTGPLSAPHMQKGMMQETTEDFGKQVFTKILSTIVPGLFNTGGPIGKKGMGYKHGGEAQPYAHNPKAWSFGEYDEEAEAYKRIPQRSPMARTQRSTPYAHNPKAWSFGEYDEEAGEYERVMVNPPLGFKSAAEHKMQMKEYEVMKAQERADKAAAAKERRAEEAHAAKLAREATKESGMVRSETMPFQKPPAIMTTILGSQTFPSYKETGSPHVYQSQAGLEEQAAREEHAEKVGFPYFVSREGR